MANVPGGGGGGAEGGAGDGGVGLPPSGNGTSPPSGVSVLPSFPIGRSASFPARVTLQLPSYDCSRPGGGCRGKWTRSVSSRCDNQDDQADPAYDSGDGECLGYGDYGFVGEARIFDTARAYWKPIGDDGEEVSPVPTEPANKADIDALAYSIARDFYGWRKFAFDVKYEGLAPVIPNGYNDEIIWTADGDEWSTRMMTAPPDDRTEQMNHAFIPPDNCNCCEAGFCGLGGCPECSRSTVFHARTGGAIPARDDSEYGSPRMGEGIVRIYRNDGLGNLTPCGYAFAFNGFSQDVSPNTWIQLGTACCQYVVISEDCGQVDA